MDRDVKIICGCLGLGFEGEGCWRFIFLEKVLEIFFFIFIWVFIFIGIMGGRGVVGV